MPICALCQNRATKVYLHHFPVPRELGGTETIPVCPNCHQRDHQLINRLTHEIETGSIQIELTGSDPHDERRSAIKAALERRLFP